MYFVMRDGCPPADMPPSGESGHSQFGAKSRFGFMIS